MPFPSPRIKSHRTHERRFAVVVSLRSDAFSISGFCRCFRFVLAGALVFPGVFAGLFAEMSGSGNSEKVFAAEGHTEWEYVDTIPTIPAPAPVFETLPAPNPDPSRRASRDEDQSENRPGEKSSSAARGRWSLPRPYLPNISSMQDSVQNTVHNTFQQIFPERGEPVAEETPRANVPGFRGRFSDSPPHRESAVSSETVSTDGVRAAPDVYSRPLQAPVPWDADGFPTPIPGPATPPHGAVPVFVTPGYAPFGVSEPYTQRDFLSGGESGYDTAPRRIPPSNVPEAEFAPSLVPGEDSEMHALIEDFSGTSTMILPQRNLEDPITIVAKSGWSRQIENKTVYFLEGDCTIRQGNDKVLGPSAVIWIDHLNSPKTASVYLESEDSERPIQVELRQGNVDARIQDKKWFGSFRTKTDIDVYLERHAHTKQELPAIYARADQMRFPGSARFRPRQLTQSDDSGGKSMDFRNIHFFPRSDTLTEISWKNDEQSQRSVGLITNGFTLVIDGITVDGEGRSLMTGDTIDISADNAVVWTENLAAFTSQAERKQGNEYDLEIYLEGNIKFLEGNRTIYAKKMYYDVKNRIGYLLDAEFLAPATGFEGLVRMKAEVIRQLGNNQFLANNAFITTSRLGEPAYRIQSRRMTYEELLRPTQDAAQPDKQQLVVAENNVVCLGELPVFYWPWMAADLRQRDPFMYLRSVSFGHDSSFGTQVRTTWNPYQIFNIKNQIEGTTWDISLDYFSKRGLGHGTNFTYERDDFFGISGPTAGLLDVWGIADSGTDNLGRDRRELDPEASYRYRAIWKHRQLLADDWLVTAEVGKTSDGNFMKEYFDREWDRMKDQSTGIELKKTNENRALALYLGGPLDDHVTDTNWLPKLEHSWLGQSLPGDRLLWYEYTRVGYAQLNVTDAPRHVNATREDNQNYFGFLPWELQPGSANDPNGPYRTLDAGGEILSTKHELDLPLDVGPVRFVPYVLGEFAHWGEDVYGDAVQRIYYQGGVRANLPVWKLMSGYGSRTWYVNGLAHKIDFNAEFSYARSDVNWDSLVQYDALDDHSVQSVRRRFLYTTFGGMLPVRFDERYYAIRSGLAGNVSSPATALADDMTMIRLGMKHRWQTKRGPSGNRRIIDWITFETNINLYPDKEHNFGESLGLFDYDFRWHVGDRFAVLSSGIYDFFSDGQRITRIGAVTERPGRGRLYLGIDRLDGPLSATYLNLNLAYRMNEKYTFEMGASYDLEYGDSIGHDFVLTRTGESFALGLGTSVNPSRGTWGVSFDVRPVFLTNYKNRSR